VSEFYAKAVDAASSEGFLLIADVLI